MADKSFPVLSPSMWVKLRLQFKRSIPTTITAPYISSIFGISLDSAKNNVVTQLRNIGVIDKDGKTDQDIAKKMRDDSMYPQLCKELLHNLYPQELRDAFPDKQSNRDRVKSWFMHHTGAGDSAAYKMTLIYMILLEADPTIKDAISNGKPKESKANPTKKAIVKGSSVVHAKEVTKNKENPANTNANNGVTSFNPELNINIQIHISSDASSEQIKSIFENMAKYLKS